MRAGTAVTFKVISKGGMRRLSPDSSLRHPIPLFKNYSIEQQASMVSDYWLLRKYGFYKYRNVINYKDYDLNEPVGNLIKKYHNVMKRLPLLVSGFCLALSGCWMGDRVPYAADGSATVSKGSVCIHAAPGDVLRDYALWSSQNDYQQSIASSFDDLQHEAYPNRCIIADMKKGYRYSLEYRLNDKTYRVDFDIDLNGVVVMTKGKTFQD